MTEQQNLKNQILNSKVAQTIGQLVISKLELEAEIDSFNAITERNNALETSRKSEDAEESVESDVSEQKQD